MCTFFFFLKERQKCVLFNIWSIVHLQFKYTLVFCNQITKINANLLKINYWEKCFYNFFFLNQKLLVACCKMLQYILYCSVCQKPLQICYLLQHFINIAKKTLQSKNFTAALSKSIAMWKLLCISCNGWKSAIKKHCKTFCSVLWPL